MILFVSSCDPGLPDISNQDAESWTPVSPSFHVKTNGSPKGDGSINSPWDLATALTHSSIKPGDTIYIHDGTYTGFYQSRLYGTVDSPIIIRPWHNDTVIIDGAAFLQGVMAVLDFGGQYTHLIGIKITNSASDHFEHVDTNDGVYFIGPGNKLLNCIISGNSGNGIGFWSTAINAEVSGCIIYNNGAIGPNRGHGHGLYVQQGTEGNKIIRNNIIFSSFGKGIQVYGTGVPVHNTIIEDNIFFNAALAAGVHEQNIYIGSVNYTANNHIVRNNVFYASPGFPGTPASIKFGDAFTYNGEASFTGNYSVDSFLHITRRWDRMTARNNTYIARTGEERIVVGHDVYDYVTVKDYDWNIYHRGRIGENNASGFQAITLQAIQEYNGQELNSIYHDDLPKQTAVFLKPAGENRWHAAVFNWADAQSVNAAVPGLKAGDSYALFYVSALNSGAATT